MKINTSFYSSNYQNCNWCYSLGCHCKGWNPDISSSLAVSNLNHRFLSDANRNRCKTVAKGCSFCCPIYKRLARFVYEIRRAFRLFGSSFSLVYLEQEEKMVPL